MKQKMSKKVCLALLICFSIFNLFQSYQTKSENLDGVNLSTLAYASSENGEVEEPPIPDPWDQPLGFGDWLESILDKIGSNK